VVYQNDSYQILKVIPMDERLIHGVNNSVYTNVVAKLSLQFALQVYTITNLICTTLIHNPSVIGSRVAWDHTQHHMDGHREQHLYTRERLARHSFELAELQR